jgi:hypothetical protein
MHIPDGARVVWSCQPTKAIDGTFVVWLYGSDGRNMNSLVSTHGYDHGAYTFQREGDYYLEVVAMGESWSMKLQVFQSG